MKAFFIKMPNHSLVPASEGDRKMLFKISPGEPVELKYRRARNYLFHKKFFALMHFAFDYWEPDFEKSFDRFRKDITILAGYYEESRRLNGEVRVEAQSIAFDKMPEEEFESLYTKCIDVIVTKILPAQGFTDETLRQVVELVEEFE